MPQDAPPVHSRTVTWPSPASLRHRRLSANGLDFFRGLAASSAPQVPLYEVIGFRLADLGDGWSRFDCTPGEHLYNPLGTVHGGVPASLIDSAAGVAVQTTLEEGLVSVTVRLHIDFVRAIMADTGPLICEGRVAKPGRQVAIADATLTGADDGKLYARGQGTFVVTRRRQSADIDGDAAGTHETGTRTFTWSDPAVVAQAGRTADSGLHYLQAMANQEIPAPAIAQTMDFTLAEVAHGRAVFACTPQSMHYNPMGGVHGGLAATLLDSATGCAVHSQLEKGFGFTTVYLTVEYFRGLTDEVGEVRAEAEVVRSGRRLAVADGRLVGADGTVYARGTATCLIFPF